MEPEKIVKDAIPEEKKTGEVKAAKKEDAEKLS